MFLDEKLYIVGFFNARTDVGCMVLLYYATGIQIIDHVIICQLILNSINGKIIQNEFGLDKGKISDWKRIMRKP
jgi:hypothetical protein